MNLKFDFLQHASLYSGKISVKNAALNTCAL